jgi:hypothetical protein
MQASVDGNPILEIRQIIGNFLATRQEIALQHETAMAFSPQHT